MTSPETLASLERRYPDEELGRALWHFQSKHQWANGIFHGYLVEVIFDEEPVPYKTYIKHIKWLQKKVTKLTNELNTLKKLLKENKKPKIIKKEKKKKA